MDEISVFIFDEEFVQENVRTKGKGLETIVMMGEQVDLDTQITTKIAEGAVVDNKIVEQTALKEKYENASDTSSPQYFLTKSEMNCGKMEVGQILTEIYARKTEFDFIILPAGLHKSAGFLCDPVFLARAKRSNGMSQTINRLKPNDKMAL